MQRLAVSGEYDCGDSITRYVAVILKMQLHRVRARSVFGGLCYAVSVKADWEQWWMGAWLAVNCGRFLGRVN